MDKRDTTQNIENAYIPFRSQIKEVINHTGVEYTFRMAYNGEVKPGQFFEVSIPRFGEAPISVSGIGKAADGESVVDLTVRRVGRVTNEVFERCVGDFLLLRGPYGNGFDLSLYKGRELVIVAGGTGVSPVRGVVDHFARNPGELTGLTLVAGFKTPADLLFRADFERWRGSANIILTVDDNKGDAAYQTGLVTAYIPGLEVADLGSARAIVVGPPAMMRFSLKALLDKGFKEEHIWVSYERRMCCGLGKCGHCRINDVYVCLNGPVFNYSDAKAFID